MQVDLRVRRRLPGPLDQREQRTRAPRGPADDGSVRWRGTAARRIRSRAHMRSPALAPRVPSRCSRCPRSSPSRRGGYFDAARLRAGIAACLLAAARGRRRRRARCRASRRAASRSAALAALTAWTALSLLWAPLGGPAVDDVQRLLLYLAAFAPPRALLRARGGEAGPSPLLLAGIAVAAAYGLSERLLPGAVRRSARARAPATGSRSRSPTGTATGAFAALGLVLAAGLVGDRRPPARPCRAAAAAAAPLLGLALYLTFSRGALGAPAAGLAVLLALDPRAPQLRAARARRRGAALPGRRSRELVARRRRAAQSERRRRAPRCSSCSSSPAPRAAFAAPPAAARPRRCRCCARSRSRALVATLVATVAAVDAGRRAPPSHRLGAARLGRRATATPTGASRCALRRPPARGRRHRRLPRRVAARAPVPRARARRPLAVPRDRRGAGPRRARRAAGALSAAWRPRRRRGAGAGRARGARRLGAARRRRLGLGAARAHARRGSAGRRVLAAAEPEPERPPEPAATDATPLATAGAPASTSSPPPAPS